MAYVATGPRFEIEKALNDEFYFTLKAANGETIASSMGETYKTKQGARLGIDSVIRNAAIAEIVDLT
jgi:uncharacterized protein YegP (UPF0339 family)